MTAKEQKKESTSSPNARAQRIRDAFPMEEITPEPKRQKQQPPIQDEQPIEELSFNGSDAPSDISPLSFISDEKESKEQSEDKADPRLTLESKETNESSDDFVPEIILTAEEMAPPPIQPKKEPKKKEKKTFQAEERTEKIITVRPHAHRSPKPKEHTPFRKHPFVLKALAFAREYKKELPHNYLLFTPFLVLGVCVLLVFFRIFYAIAAPTTGANIYACVAIINVVAFLPLCTIYLRHRPLLSDRMGWKLPSADKLPLMFIATVSLFFGAAALTSLGAYFGITDFRYHLFTFYDIPATTSIAGILFSTVTLALIPALTEEILCRGIIFAEYQYDNTPLALIMSAIFSAVLQFDPSRLLVGLFCGFLLGTVRMVTNSLTASIIVHMLYNVACLFYEHFFGIMGNQLSEFLILFFLCAVFALISFFFLFSTAEKICRTYAGEQKEITVDLHTSSGVALKSSLKVAFISPTLYFVLVFYLVSSFFI